MRMEKHLVMDIVIVQHSFLLIGECNSFDHESFPVVKAGVAELGQRRWV